MAVILQAIKDYKRILIIFMAPLILLPLLFVGEGKVAPCAFCILLMTFYWITEVFPLSITAFIPLVLFPLMGIMKAKDVGVAYINNTTWLYFGGLVVAIAVEKTMLHKRIAIKILLLLGTTPQCLMLGFMLTTYFLSMWLSNTATTAMMIPILQGVLQQMDYCETEDQMIDKDSASDTTIQTDKIAEKRNKKLSRKRVLFDRGITLCIPYAASIGGIATLTGSPTNIVLSGQFNQIFPKSPTTLSFGLWFAYNFPCSIFIVALAYIWLVTYHNGLRSLFVRCGKGESSAAVRRLLIRQYKSLGTMKWREACTLTIFVVLAFLWFTRSPGLFPGWGSLFEQGYVTDSTTVMALLFLFFIIPERRPIIFGGSKPAKGDPNHTILLWEDIHQKCAWSVIFLIGGGFALAKGAVHSDLTLWLATQLKSLQVLPPWLICLLITTVASIFTECTSNVAAATIFVPVLSQLSVAVGMHPLYLLVPVVVSTSLAFMLPVATPPNAIAFQSGRLKIIDMLKAGWLLNFIGVAVINLFINSYGKWLFDLQGFPDWAATIATNSSTSH